MAPLPVLKKFDICVYKDKDPAAVPPDRAQVPALATINFYGQGSTVKVAVPSPGIAAGATALVTVYNPGSIAVGDTLQVELDSSKTLVVGSVTVVDLATSTLSLTNNTGATIPLSQGNRLLKVGPARPTAYADPLGTVPIGSSIATDPATGRAFAYIGASQATAPSRVGAYRFDYVITGIPNARLFIDAEGSFVIR